MNEMSMTLSRVASYLYYSISSSWPNCSHRRREDEATASFRDSMLSWWRETMNGQLEVNRGVRDADVTLR